MAVENMVEECPILFFVQRWNISWIIPLTLAHSEFTQHTNQDGLYIMDASLSMKLWCKVGLLYTPNARD